MDIVLKGPATRTVAKTRGTTTAVLQQHIVESPRTDEECGREATEWTAGVRCDRSSDELEAEIRDGCGPSLRSPTEMTQKTPTALRPTGNPVHCARISTLMAR